MSRLRLVFALVLVVAALPAARPALAGPGDAGADSVYLVGEFVDPVCIYQHGMQGTAQKVCATVPGRVDQGMFFLDIRRRELFPVIGVTHWEDPRARFLAALGDTFAVQARIWRFGPSGAVAIQSMTPWREQRAAGYSWWPVRWEWSVLLGCGLIAAAYLLALTLWRRRLGAPDARFERARAALFLGGLAVVVGSLNGPIHDLSDQYFFSTHMVQHLLLAQVFPLMFLIGLPPWLRRALVAPRAVGAAWGFLAAVPMGFILYTVVFSIWHVPVLYNLMMRDHDFHILMHLMVMVTATLMWWPVAGGDAVRRPLSPGGQMLYLFLLGTPMMIVAAMIVFAPQPLYDWYRFAPPLWGQSALEDQRLGGLIMWVPGGLFFWLVMSVVYFRWSRRESGTEDPYQIPAVP
jgi:putative membrane protein